ncbi:hypothetical protein G6F22_011569 [Rhizopus arrhizus]|nr:hypothetical protein G6F22_011569 [Rhizopus arrhizus]
MAQARQAEHLATLQAARKQQEVLIAQRDAARAGLQRAQALKDRADLNLSYTQITSPIDGTIGRRALRVGAYVSPGTAILAVVPLQQAYVVANFRERQLMHMRPGQTATITGDAYPDAPLHGRQRHGQFHQGGAAPAGQDRAGRPARQRASAACRHVRRSRGRHRGHAGRGRAMTHRLISRALLLSTLLGIGGCAVGPDFVAPQAQLPAQWREPAATPAPSAPVPESLNTSWWASFGDPTLTALINEATAANVDIRIAYEHLRQSRAALGITEADTLPRVGAGASYQRGQNSEAGLADPSGRDGRSSFNLWQTGVDASWELDLWGRVRREVEQSGAQSQAALEAQRAVVLSIRAETARNYILLRGAQNQLAVLNMTLDNANHNLALTRLRQREGVATELDVSQADAQAAAIEAAVPPLVLRVDQLMNALALLLEQPPHALHERLA